MKNYVSQKDLDLTKVLLKELHAESAHIKYLSEKSSCSEDELPAPLTTWVEKWTSFDFQFENKRLEKRRRAFQKALNVYSFELITEKNSASKEVICREYVSLVEEAETVALEPSWRASKPHSPKKETFWIIIASILWVPIFAPLWIKIEEDAGLQTESIAFTGCYLIAWSIGIAIYSAKNKYPIFVGRNRITATFISIFFLQLILILARSLFIAKYGF
jgi:hypothetical protein